ncbi:MAG: SusC/RagA family TonB-linked outer membrane protein [Proteiniphilum acetatigenes]|uniref:SusC/RagA family TonB-linked outer membrane protein n=1 Tax=Proteiniphilum acetatigenes TaxID=294710 RepID=A0A101HDD3_9BACT|nr:MAG: SusC/RagA family TonB-linked outer membrane protein [Proteiniphilum acetatigenes]
MNNSIKKSLSSLACMLLWVISLNAQVNGMVKDEYGRILQGVLITSENGKDVTITDKNGNYDITISDESKYLTFSMLGYVSQNLNISDVLGETQDITLKRAETFDLDEKVFLGNYTQRKDEVTGSIARVTGKELERSPVANLSMSLAGRLPGLFTRETYSEPARTNTELWVRGSASPNGGTALVVIDGFPYDYNANQLFEYITANEVESISVLKDASTQALYGIQGANGVIVITTKRGVKQPLKIDVSINHTLEQRTTTPPHINSADFVQLRNQAGLNDGRGEYSYFSKMAVDGFLAGENPEYFPNNNWREMNAKDITQMSRVNMNLTGGNDKAVFYTNVNMLYQDGMWKIDPSTTRYNPNNQFIWANIRSNVDVKLAKYLSIGLNLSGNIKRERTVDSNCCHSIRLTDYIIGGCGISGYQSADKAENRHTARTANRYVFFASFPILRSLEANRFFHILRKIFGCSQPIDYLFFGFSMLFRGIERFVQIPYDFIFLFAGNGQFLLDFFYIFCSHIQTSQSFTVSIKPSTHTV